MTVLKEQVELAKESFRKDFLLNKSFNDEFVISRNMNNSPLSYFKDDIWDLSPYRLVPKDKKYLNFHKISNGNIRNEAKRLVLLIMFYKRGVSDTMLSNDSIIKHYFNGVIYPLAKHSQKNNMTVRELLENSMELFYFIKNLKVSRYNGVKSFLNFLYKINNNIINIDYKHDTKLMEYLISKHAIYRNTRDQVEVIPTQILDEIMTHNLKNINELNLSLEELIDFIETVLYDKKMKISEFLKQNKLCSNIFIKYNVKTRANFGSFLLQIQKIVKLLIHAYSGMRSSEVSSLYCNCFEVHENKDKNLYYCTIKGFGTKLQAKKYEKWITSKKVEMGINILEKINAVLLKKNSYKIIECPLFLKTSCISGKIPSNQLMANIDSLKGMIHPDVIITENDILELESIDPFRDWRNDSEFKIGNAWQFKSHQFRRTLVVYAIQSGLVSIGSLQHQLKHLVRDMTVYYGNGATFAKKLFNVSRDHIGKDMENVKLELNALSYIKNVIFSKEKLYAAHGSLIENNKKKIDVNFKDYLLENRETTLNQFKNGEIKYTTTAIGGCVSIEPCDNKLIGVVSACLKCDGAIITKKKLDNTILEQEKFISGLREDSMELRTDKNELEALKDYRIKTMGEE